MEPKDTTLKFDSFEWSSYFPSEPKIKDIYFDDKKLTYVLNVTGSIWFGAIEIMDILLYDKMRTEDLEYKLEKYVHEDNMTFFCNLRPKMIGGYVNQEIEENTILLNLVAVHILVLDSRLDCNKFFISWLDRQVNTIKNIFEKHEKQIFEKRRKAFELATKENAYLKQQIQTNILMIDQQRNDMKMFERRVQILEIENLAKDDVLGQQIIDAGVLQCEIQSLTVDNQIKNDALKKYEHETGTIPHKIQVLENDIHSKDNLLKQLTSEMEEMSRKNLTLELTMKSKTDAFDQEITGMVRLASRIQNLEFRNHTNNEELKSMQNQMSLLDSENAMLKIQIQKATEEGQILRTQDALLHLFGKNFVPKLYDKKLEEQFIIFKLNEENFFKYYAVRSRIRTINEQIKTIQARHPRSLELLRVTFYPNEVNLFKLMRNHLKHNMQFKGNFFTVLSDEYTDEDLKNDVLKLSNEAENMRQEVYKMMGIERYFRTNENVFEPTCTAKGKDNKPIPISANEITNAGGSPNQDQESKSQTSEERGNTTSDLDSTQDSKIANVEGGKSKIYPDPGSRIESAQDSEFLSGV